jgi:signal transduction histidine kinase
MIKATGEPMPDGGFVTTYEDITESVKAAVLLKKANEELESRVQERTSELEVITQELKQITRSKTHFLAAASHDLLQPINAARLFTHSIYERSEDSTKVKSLSKSIDHSLVTADELLRALLDISKLDAGGIEPDYKILSVEDFLFNVESEMKAIAIDKGILLSVDTESLYVLSDRQLLFSVLLNLVTNAIRYTPEEGKVLIRSCKGESGMVDIIVEDSGVGIEDVHLETIFTEFYQVKDQNRRNSQGLGLGLSIVKRVCALLEIDIDVKSEVGKGSTFKLSLPESQSKPVIKSSSITITKTETTITKLAGINVLCLDNDESVLNGMQTMIEYWGCNVVCSLDYQEAINLSENMEFDIVLADYRLDDDETGLDFLKVSQTKSTSLKGVLITAEQDKLLKPKVEQQGFSYLAKPVEPASLKSLMMYLVSKN